MTKSVRLLVSVLVFCLTLPISAAAGEGATAKHLILTNATDLSELRLLVRALEERGARIRHLFPPDAAIGFVPGGVDPSAIPTLAGRVRVERDTEQSPSDDIAIAHHDVWRVWQELSRDRPIGTGYPHFSGDALETKHDEPSDTGAAKSMPCANNGWTSEYLLGDIAIGIVLTESVSGDPAENTEDWDVAREDEVVAEIIQATDQLAAAYPDAGLDFVYEVHRGVPTEIEPIIHDSGDRGAWITDALTFLGQPHARGYARDLRDRHDTDWATVAFVVDSLNDGDGKFLDGLFAFAYLGGPYMVMTYDNNGWGIGRTDTVFAHEFGHNFRALDEYLSASVACDRRSGVLQIENQNSAVGCMTSDSCLMRADAFPSTYCAYTVGQMGLRDSDSDGIPDLRDEPPQSDIVPVDPNPLAVANITINGDASSRPEPAEAEYLAAHTLNRLAGVEYRLDGGTWTTTNPSDGSWGDLCEAFDFDLVALTEGWHDVETRAISNVCDPADVDICDPPRLRYEDSFPVERIYVNTDCAEDAFEPNDSAAEAVAIPAGVIEPLQLCAYDPDRFKLFLRAGASLGARVAYTNITAELTLELLAPNGDRIDFAPGLGGTADVMLAAAGTTGWYSLVVDGRNEAESAYRVIITASCIDDRFEPNGVAATAPTLPGGPSTDLQICRTDEDWYRVSVSDGADVTVKLQHTAALGDLDLELYDPTMTLVDRAATTGDLETVTGTALTAGVHFVHVIGATPTDENRHDLDLSSTLCLDDNAENDDDAATARSGLGRFEGRICGSDADWVRVDIGRTSQLRVTLGFNAARNLDLELRDDADIVISRSTGGTGLERIDEERLLPGTYYVRVFSPDPDQADYVLDISLDDPILLYALEQRPDVYLDWTDADVECYWLRRSTVKQTFDGGFETVIDLATASEEVGADVTSWTDPNKVDDGILYFYDVSPIACSNALLSATKTVGPYPVFEKKNLVQPPVFSIAVRNEGQHDATSIKVYDDLPSGVPGFRVLSIPSGATDNSSPTGGQWGSGYVQVEGFSLAPGESGVVKFELDVIGSATNSPIMRNQGRVTGISSLGQFLDVSTDDPSTHAPYDSTDIIAPLGFYPLSVTTFWNQDVDIDVRVVDPCGNMIGPADLPNVECPTGVPGGISGVSGGCGDVWPWGWYETVTWGGGVTDPTPGTYEIWLRYTDSNDNPASTCRHGGLEDVVVLIEKWSWFTDRWVVLDPNDRGWVKVTDIVLP